MPNPEPSRGSVALATHQPRKRNEEPFELQQCHYIVQYSIRAADQCLRDDVYGGMMYGPETQSPR